MTVFRALGNSYGETGAGIRFAFGCDGSPVLFNDAVKNGDIKLQAEPPANAQDYYAELGVLVSEVLANEDVDPASRLAEVEEEFQAFVLD